MEYSDNLSISIKEYGLVNLTQERLHSSKKVGHKAKSNTMTTNVINNMKEIF